MPYQFLPIIIFLPLPSLLGKYLSVLPVDPKLGKMLIMGAIFHCFDPVLTIVSALSVRDPFLLPQDKKDVSNITILVILYHFLSALASNLGTIH